MVGVSLGIQKGYIHELQPVGCNQLGSITYRVIDPKS